MILDLIESLYPKNLVKIPKDEFFRPLMSPRQKACSLVAEWKKSNKLFRGVVPLCLGHALGRVARWWAPSSATLGHAPTHSRPLCVGGVGGRAGDRRRPTTAAAAGRRSNFPATFPAWCAEHAFAFPTPPRQWLCSAWSLE